MQTRRFKSWILCALLAAGAAMNSPAHAQEAASQDTPTLAAMSKELICPCPSCGGKALDQCEPQCHDGQERRDSVAALIKEGKGHDQILQSMAATYGTQILGEPPREGWGAMSVMMPLLCLAAGAVPLMWFTRSRKGASQGAGAKRPSARRASAVDSAEDARVAAALKEFDF